MNNKLAIWGKQDRYGRTAIEIINRSSILTEEELGLIVDLNDELVDNFLHAQIFRTRTEMEVSVLNDLKFPTPDAKYWQSQREQGVHFHELVMLSYEYRKNLVEIKKLERKLASEKDDLERELLDIEIEKLKFISRNQERVAKDRIREIREWHEIKARLIPQMAHSLTDCDEHQLISYTRRFVKQWLTAGDSGSPSERQNLLGQMDMAIKTCISKKCFGKIFNELHPKIRKQIADQYGLQTEISGRLLEK
jgi:hypothetical protein